MMEGKRLSKPIKASLLVLLVGVACLAVSSIVSAETITEPTESEQIRLLTAENERLKGRYEALEAKYWKRTAWMNTLTGKYWERTRYLDRLEGKYWARTAYMQRLEAMVEKWRSPAYWAANYKPNRPYTRAQLYSLAHMAGWPDYMLPKLYRVVDCESGRSWNPSNGYYAGLMQHAPGNGGYTRTQLLDPLINLRQGWLLYQDRGWQPWPNCGRK